MPSYNLSDYTIPPKPEVEIERHCNYSRLGEDAFCRYPARAVYADHSYYILTREELIAELFRRNEYSAPKVLAAAGWNDVADGLAARFAERSAAIEKANHERSLIVVNDFQTYLERWLLVDENRKRDDALYWAARSYAYDKLDEATKTSGDISIRNQHWYASGLLKAWREELGQTDTNTPIEELARRVGERDLHSHLKALEASRLAAAQQEAQRLRDACPARALQRGRVAILQTRALLAIAPASSQRFEKKFVNIQSDDYWFTPSDNMEYNWALVDSHSRLGAVIYFMHDLAGVFDCIAYPNTAKAHEALEKNYFTCVKNQDDNYFVNRRPIAPFHAIQHRNGHIYSSRRYWRDLPDK